MKEFDVVSLIRDFNSLVAGTQGTIVYVHVEREMFIVEFCDNDGSTITLEDMSSGDLRLEIAYEA